MTDDDHKPFLIRGYRRSDRETVRKLCCDTGFLGDPIDPVYEDRELFADFLTTYYTVHEPESCFLLEVGGEIRGYLLGSRKPLRNQLHARTGWLHRWSRFACRVLGIRVTTRGSMPQSGLLVCNHLSYLDVVVLSSIGRWVFVAKRDVAAWPLFGWLAHAAGTIFVDRQRPLASAFAVNRIRAVIATGLPVV